MSIIKTREGAKPSQPQYIDESEIDFGDTVSNVSRATQAGQEPVYIDESELLEETTGITGAAKSGFDRLAAGFYEITGDEEKADEYMAQSRAYRPSVASYKDISDPVDVFNYVAEGIAGGAVYAPLMVASLPVAVPAGIGLAALEAGATYNEQEEGAKSVVRAISAAGANVALERVGLGKFAGNSAIRNTLLNAVEEGGRGAATHLAAEVIGQGNSFEEAMANIDEAIVAGAATRIAMQPLEGRTASATDVITRPLEDRRATGIGTRDDTINTFEENKADVGFISRSRAAGGTQMSDSELLRMARQMNDESNTIIAAQELAAHGARLQPSALDFDINVDTVVKEYGPTMDGSVPTLNTKLVPSVKNVARDYFKLTDTDMSTDRQSKWFEDKFNIPFLGSRLTGRDKDYRTTQEARGKIERQFEMDVIKPFKKVLQDIYPQDTPEGIQTVNGILQMVQDYSKGVGELPDPIADRLLLLNVDGDDRQTFMDKVVQMKRVNQIADRMQETSGKGELGSVAVGGIEALATGGMPVVSTVANFIGQGAVGFLSHKTRSQIQDVLEGNRKDGKKRVISEEDKAKLIEQLAGLEAMLGRLGVDNSEEDEDKYKDLTML